MEAILDPEAKEGLLPISFLQSIGEAYTLLRYLIETEWMKVTEMYNGGISWNPLLQLRRKMKRAFFINASVEFVRFSKFNTQKLANLKRLEDRFSKSSRCKASGK